MTDAVLAARGSNGGNGTVASNQNDENSRLSGGWTGDSIDYWATDPSDGNRATGADACLNADNMSGGSPAANQQSVPGYTWAQTYASRELVINARSSINACHLIADILGGSGRVQANLATCGRGANTYSKPDNVSASMRVFERLVQAEAKIPGASVYYQVVPTYDGSHTIPTAFIMYARSSLGWSDDIMVGNVVVGSNGIPVNLGTAIDKSGNYPGK